ncbi:hypothetical protein GQ54DRAFT_297860 [Martensiomyces pterosporus]|nr:hypothetical protein GQ54DRAFT_297860 [Martensiomyces pterosporus]
MSSSKQADLFASKNGKLSVRVNASVPATLLNVLLGETAHDDDDNTGSHFSKGTERGLSRALYASSIGGSYLAVSYAGRFMLLEAPERLETSGELRLVSIGCEAASPGETITAICCLSIYSSHSRHYSQSREAKLQGQRGDDKSLCVAVGYSSGYLRIFSVHGHLLTTHQFHSHQLAQIRLRMPSQANSAHTRGEMRYVANEDSIGGGGSAASTSDSEEVCLTYTDGTMVSIDGKSLYLALRLCLDDAASPMGGGHDDGGPSFMYKKWAFDLHSPRVYDAVSYGPTVHRDPLASLAKATSTSSPLLSGATARFLVAPQHGDAAFGVYMTNDDARMSLSAVDIAGKMAAKVTGAVLNIAKSYFWRSGNASADPAAEPRSSAVSAALSACSEPGTLVPCAFGIRDSPRKVLSISLAPAPYNLAALTDSLGRVLIFDLESCEIVHMLKGLRGSQCAWLEIDSTANEAGSTAEPPDSKNKALGRRRRMFVVIYAARRGTVEAFELGSLERPVASVNVGLGWSLVQCPTQPLGGSLVVGSADRARRAVLPAPASCFLVDSKGSVAHIEITV